jgi:DNA-binding transcriptional LysR family regulator
MQKRSLGKRGTARAAALEADDAERFTNGSGRESARRHRRLGEQVAKDMIAVRIGPDLRMAVVGRRHTSRRGRSREPCRILRAQLHRHAPANARGGRRELNVRVDGQLVFNSLRQRVDAAVAGLGLAYMPEDVVRSEVERGALVRVLEDWCAPFPGYHLYYPSRRQRAPAFGLLVEALRYSRPARSG